MLSEKAINYDLSVKTQKAWLSSNNDVVMANLSRNRPNPAESGIESLPKYYFERVGETTLEFVECGGKINKDVLTALAEHLVRDDRCSVVKYEGAVIAELEVKHPANLTNE